MGQRQKKAPPPMRSEQFFSRLPLYVLTFLGAMILVAIYDQAEPALLNLRRSAIFPSSIPIPNGERVLEETTGCSKHYNDADACNANQDERGKGCRWCTNDLSDRVCVADDSQGYKFAPCNNWICDNEDDPMKSDIAACERV